MVPPSILRFCQWKLQSPSAINYASIIKQFRPIPFLILCNSRFFFPEIQFRLWWRVLTLGLWGFSSTFSAVVFLSEILHRLPFSFLPRILSGFFDECVFLWSVLVSRISIDDELLINDPSISARRCFAIPPFLRFSIRILVWFWLDSGVDYFKRWLDHLAHLALWLLKNE